MRITIKEGEVGVLWKKGIISRTLEPGKHRFSLLLGNRVDSIATLPVDYVCQTGEYTTSDNLTVRFFLRARIDISDPIMLLRAMTYDQLNSYISNTLSDTARRIVLSGTLDDLLAVSAEFDQRIQQKCTPIFAKVGLHLEAVSPVSILIPRSLKQAFEAELAAKKKAIADLEEARGRTATLRHLANAAEMVEKRPILMQLLLGQKARNVHFQFNEHEKHSK